jgi:hypothetical protein
MVHRRHLTLVRLTRQPPGTPRSEVPLMPKERMLPPLPIDLQRVAGEWGWSLDDLEAALEIEREREARDSRRGECRPSGKIPQMTRQRRRRTPEQRLALGPEYGWCDW